jgi:hypothetical protein
VKVKQFQRPKSQIEAVFIFSIEQLAVLQIFIPILMHKLEFFVTNTQMVYYNSLYQSIVLFYHGAKYNYFVILCITMMMISSFFIVNQMLRWWLFLINGLANESLSLKLLGIPVIDFSMNAIMPFVSSGSGKTHSDICHPIRFSWHRDLTVESWPVVLNINWLIYHMSR